MFVPSQRIFRGPVRNTWQERDDLKPKELGFVRKSLCLQLSQMAMVWKALCNFHLITHTTTHWSPPLLRTGWRHQLMFCASGLSWPLSHAVQSSGDFFPPIPHHHIYFSLLRCLLSTQFLSLYSSLGKPLQARILSLSDMTLKRCDLTHGREREKMGVIGSHSWRFRQPWVPRRRKGWFQ